MLVLREQITCADRIRHREVRVSGVLGHGWSRAFPTAFVCYPSDEWSRRDAWIHCQKNPPVISIDNRSIIPLVRIQVNPVTGASHPTNPYRKSHIDDQFWRWEIVDWRFIGENHRLLKPPRTRWERLMGKPII